MQDVDDQARDVFETYRWRFEALMRESGLDDPAQFLAGPSFEGSFEEVPLYSRYSQISFLADRIVLERNQMVILASVDLLRRIISGARDAGWVDGDFVAMVSVLGIDESWPNFVDAMVVPCVWTARPTSRSLAFLGLAPSSDPIVRFVERTVGTGYQVYESGRPLERLYIRPLDMPIPRSWLDPLQLGTR